MTEYFAFNQNEPPEWAKKFKRWLKDRAEAIWWFLSGSGKSDTIANIGMLIVLGLFALGLFVVVKDITSERLPIDQPYRGVIVGHAITGENRDAKTVTGINTDGDATIYVVPGESEKKKIAIDIGISVIEFTATPTEYFRTYLGMDVVIQMYSTPRGLVKDWRIVEYVETN